MKLFVPTVCQTSAPQSAFTVMKVTDKIYTFNLIAADTSVPVLLITGVIQEILYSNFLSVKITATANIEKQI